MSTIGSASERNGSSTRSPSSAGPAKHSCAITTSSPWRSSGTNGIGGAGITLAIVDSPSGAASDSARNELRTSGVAGSRSMPPTTEGTSCSRNLNRVATPKLPPPPRIAQNRSGWLSASTSRIRPSAVTTSAASRLSIVSPWSRLRKPVPPPSVMPPIPTDAASPNPVARPCAPTAFVYSPAVRPVCAQAVRPSASISSPRISRRSSTMPSSSTPCPAPLCPPLRTASPRPESRANETIRATSSASAGRTTAAGRRSIPPMTTVRASS